MPRTSNQSSMSRDEFRQRRAALGLTAKELARLLGCTLGTIRNIEHIGATAKRPSRTLVRLLKVLEDPAGRRLVERMVAEEE